MHNHILRSSPRYIIKDFRPHGAEKLKGRAKHAREGDGSVKHTIDSHSPSQLAQCLSLPEAFQWIRDNR